MNAIVPPEEMTAGDFRRIAALIEDKLGIKMPPSKATMLSGRLHRRVVALGLSGLAEYCSLVLDRGGLAAELPHLIDVVTTNKTDFLREPAHFDYLVGQAVPNLMDKTGAGLRRPLAVWSAACSSGQEAYSIAMVLADFAAVEPDFRFTVKATDISSACLATAARAVYSKEAITPLPYEMRKRHLLMSRDRAAKLVKIAPETRRLVSFAHLNLVEGHYPWRHPMDVIFCRNVLIYFSRATQRTLLEFLCRHLIPGGFLFLGHSETLTGVTLPVHPVAPAVYRRE